MEALIQLAMQVGILLAMALLTLVANALRKFIASKATREDMEMLQNLAEMAVWAVEQKGAGVFATKKEAARDIIFGELRNMEKLGKYPTTTIDAAIEASVGTGINFTKLTREESQNS